MPSKPAESTSRWRHGYKEIKTIGRGSFGEAMLVQDRDGQQCVMKTVDIGNLDRDQQRDAVNEVKVLASLKHPYIVRYHESFIEDGTLAIVMDHAEGGDLAQRIIRHSRMGQPFEEPQIHRWLSQIVLGLKHLHKTLIIHRDLKPQNIFLTSKDDLRLGDFGISKMLGRNTVVEEKTMGTPYYLSPEICTDMLYSFASDIWALGCVTFELASFRVPFQAQDIPSLIKKITSGAIPSVPQSYSSELRELASSFLCRDHRRRPSAADIVQTPLVQAEMRRMLGGKVIPSRPPSAQPSSGPPSQRATPQRSESPRNALRQSGNNVLMTPRSQARPFTAGHRRQDAPLVRAASAGGNKAREGFSRPPSACRDGLYAGARSRPPSPFCPAPSGRLRSAGPGGRPLTADPRRSWAMAGA